MTYRLLLATKVIESSSISTAARVQRELMKLSKFRAHKSAARATVSRAFSRACVLFPAAKLGVARSFRRLPLRLGSSRAKKACSALKYIGGERHLFCGCSKICLTSSGGKCIGAPPLKSGKLSKDYLSPPPVRTCSHGSV